MLTTLRHFCLKLLRVNLAISVRHQRQGGLSENFRFMEDLFRGANGRAGSTIVYVPTTNGVENVAAHLAAVLPASVRVVSYHGKQGMEARRCAHLAFLTGEAQVIVATIAFGMGIDKPDIRRIGTPPTCGVFVYVHGSKLRAYSIYVWIQTACSALWSAEVNGGVLPTHRTSRQRWPSFAVCAPLQRVRPQPGDYFSNSPQACEFSMMLM